jgi:hypothetical protein
VSFQHADGLPPREHMLVQPVTVWAWEEAPAELRGVVKDAAARRGIAPDVLVLALPDAWKAVGLVLDGFERSAEAGVFWHRQQYRVFAAGRRQWEEW